MVCCPRRGVGLASAWPVTTLQNGLARLIQRLSPTPSTFHPEVTPAPARPHKTDLAPDASYNSNQQHLQAPEPEHMQRETADFRNLHTHTHTPTHSSRCACPAQNSSTTKHDLCCGHSPHATHSNNSPAALQDEEDRALDAAYNLAEAEREQARAARHAQDGVLASLQAGSKQGTVVYVCTWEKTGKLGEKDIDAYVTAATFSVGEDPANVTDLTFLSGNQQCTILVLQTHVDAVVDALISRAKDFKMYACREGDLGKNPKIASVIGSRTILSIEKPTKLSPTGEVGYFNWTCAAHLAEHGTRVTEALQVALRTLADPYDDIELTFESCNMQRLSATSPVATSLSLVIKVTGGKMAGKRIDKLPRFIRAPCRYLDRDLATCDFEKLTVETSGILISYRPFCRTCRKVHTHIDAPTQNSRDGHNPTHLPPTPPTPYTPGGPQHGVEGMLPGCARGSACDVAPRRGGGSCTGHGTGSGSTAPPTAAASHAAGCMGSAATPDGSTASGSKCAGASLSSHTENGTPPQHGGNDSSSSSMLYLLEASSSMLGTDHHGGMGREVNGEGRSGKGGEERSVGEGTTAIAPQSGVRAIFGRWQRNAHNCYTWAFGAGCGRHGERDRAKSANRAAPPPQHVSTTMQHVSGHAGRMPPFVITPTSPTSYTTGTQDDATTDGHVNSDCYSCHCHCCCCPCPCCCCYCYCCCYNCCCCYCCCACGIFPYTADPLPEAVRGHVTPLRPQ